jgi:TNF receptor-associated protein 1
LFFSLGSYELTEAEGVQRGTKVIAHLRGDSYTYAKEEVIKGEKKICNILMFMVI